jgi:hypothetical protein
MHAPTLDALELDYRENDGISVLLLWNPSTDKLTVSVYDEKKDDAFELDVDPSEALDAFRHPYAYLSRGGRIRTGDLRVPNATR